LRLEGLGVPLEDQEETEQIVRWDIAASRSKGSDAVQILFPEDALTTSNMQPFRLDSLQHHDNLAITPPWRRGRSPIRVTEFLRGQKVPLHLRRQAPIVYRRDTDGTLSLVAVHVSSKDEWIVDELFDPDQEKPGHVLLLLRTSS